MFYVCGWSGGKDSTASIILAHEYGEPLDLILYSEVMFDLKHDISGELKAHTQFIREKAIPLFESWGYEVKIVRAQKDFLDEFYSVIEKPRKYQEHKGMYRGFPGNCCHIRRDLKIKPAQDYLKTITEPITQYMGIAADEEERLVSLERYHLFSLLDKYNLTEEDAFAICKKYDLLSPCYELSERGGCWFCPYAKLKEVAAVKKDMPDVWARYVSLENEKNLVNPKWNIYSRQTLHDRDGEIDLYLNQLTIFDCGVF